MKEKSKKAKAAAAKAEQGLEEAAPKKKSALDSASFSLSSPRLRREADFPSLFPQATRPNGSLSRSTFAMLVLPPLALHLLEERSASRPRDEMVPPTPLKLEQPQGRHLRALEKPKRRRRPRQRRRTERQLLQALRRLRLSRTGRSRTLPLALLLRPALPPTPAGLFPPTSLRNPPPRLSPRLSSTLLPFSATDPTTPLGLSSVPSAIVRPTLPAPAPPANFVSPVPLLPTPPANGPDRKSVV